MSFGVFESVSGRKHHRGAGNKPPQRKKPALANEWTYVDSYQPNTEVSFKQTLQQCAGVDAEPGEGGCGNEETRLPQKQQEDKVSQRAKNQNV